MFEPQIFFQFSAPERSLCAKKLHVCVKMCGEVPNHAFVVNVLYTGDLIKREIDCKSNSGTHENRAS